MCQLQDVEYGKKTENHGKRKLQLDELKNDEITEKNVKNEKCTLQDVEYGKKTENHGK